MVIIKLVEHEDSVLLAMQRLDSCRKELSCQSTEQCLGTSIRTNKFRRGTFPFGELIERYLPILRDAYNVTMEHGTN